MRARSFLVAIALLIAGCATHMLPTLQASATPSCQHHPCGIPFGQPQLHWLVEGDLGQGMSSEVPVARLQADLSICKDGGPQDMDVGAFAGQGGGGYETNSRPINWLTIWAGTDCISAKYDNLGILNQTLADQHGNDDGPGSCGGTASQPYDSIYSWLKTQTGALESSGHSLPAIYHIQGSAGASFTDRDWQVQGNVCNATGPPAQDGLNNPGFVFNLASPFTKTWEDHYLDGYGGAGTALTGTSLFGTGAGNTYPWQGTCASSTTSLPQLTNNSNGCFDNYAIILADRQVPNRDCIGVANDPDDPNGVNGGFLETDSGLSTGTEFFDLPGVDTDRNSFYGQAHHLAGGWDSGGLFLFQLNAGDCEDNSYPTYPSSFYAWDKNVIAINAENTLVDVTTCSKASGGWTSFNQGAGTYAGNEPKRFNGRAIFSINSAFTAYSLQRIYVPQTSCAETRVSGSITPTAPSWGTSGNGCDAAHIGTYTGAAGILDLSVRYWIFGINMLIWNPQYGVARTLYYGVTTNIACGVPMFAEHEIVVADPDTIPGAYTPATVIANSTAGCNSTTGSHAALATPAPGESSSGGITPLLIPNSCGPTSAGSSFFTRGGAASRQFHECWVNGQFVGPCGVIVNFRNSGGTGGAQNYVANICGTSNGTAGTTDGDPFVRDGGCFGKPYNTIMTISNPLDVEEGGALDITQTTQTIALSNVADNTLNRCTQGITSGTVTVCESSALVVFRVN